MLDLQGRYCGASPVDRNVTCCLPCPIQNWVYPDSKPTHDMPCAFSSLTLSCRYCRTTTGCQLDRCGLSDLLRLLASVLGNTAERGKQPPLSKRRLDHSSDIASGVWQ